MGTFDTENDPINTINRFILNWKVKFFMWYRNRPHVIKAIVISIFLVLFLFTQYDVSFEIVRKPAAPSESEESIRTKKVTKLREVLDPDYPILLDLDGIRDPNPVNLEEYKEKIFKENMFNTWETDRTPINRLLKDTRTKRCVERSHSYIPVSEMPTVSVVFIFVDECLSVLLRSIISIINTVPPRLLKDIILVDDFSHKVENGKR